MGAQNLGLFLIPVLMNLGNGNLQVLMGVVEDCSAEDCQPTQQGEGSRNEDILPSLVPRPSHKQKSE